MSSINPALADHTKVKDVPKPRGFRMKRDAQIGRAEIRAALRGSLVDKNGEVIVSGRLLNAAARAVHEVVKYEFI